MRRPARMNKTERLPDGAAALNLWVYLSHEGIWVFSSYKGTTRLATWARQTAAGSCRSARRRVQGTRGAPRPVAWWPAIPLPVLWVLAQIEPLWREGLEEKVSLMRRTFAFSAGCSFQGSLVGFPGPNAPSLQNPRALNAQVVLILCKRVACAPHTKLQSLDSRHYSYTIERDSPVRREVILA